MEKNKFSGDDINKLTKKLESQIKDIKDESSVNEIRNIVNELDNISPINITAKALDKDFYKKALQDKKFIESANFSNDTKKSNFSKLKVASVLVVLYLLLSSKLVTATLEYLKPLLNWNGDQLNVKHNADNEQIKYIYTYEDIEKELNKPILKPTKLPEGYELKYIDYSELLSTYIFSLGYQKDGQSENEIVYHIKSVDPDNPMDEVIEISPGYKKELVSNGIKFTLFKNIERYGSTFDYMNIHYIVSGFSNEEELINFIESLKLD